MLQPQPQEVGTLGSRWLDCTTPAILRLGLSSRPWCRGKASFEAPTSQVGDVNGGEMEMTLVCGYCWALSPSDPHHYKAEEPKEQTRGPYTCTFTHWWVDQAPPNSGLLLVSREGIASSLLRIGRFLLALKSIRVEGTGLPFSGFRGSHVG